MQAVVKLNAPPNTRVFTLQAKDPDTDHNIHYFLVRDRTGGRFEVDERSGVVRTRGTEPFQLGKFQKLKNSSKEVSCLLLLL